MGREFCAISRLAQAALKVNGLSQKLIGKGKLGHPRGSKWILTKPAIYNYITGMTTHANICIWDFS